MRVFALVFFVLFAALVAAPVFAEASDPYAVIVAGVSWAGVAIDASAVGVALASVFVVVRGLRMLLSFIRGAGADDPYDGTGESGLDFRDLH